VNNGELRRHVLFRGFIKTPKELAKQLKDAGFKPISFGVMELPDGTKVTFNERFPTLSELIEACGDKIDGLQRGFGKWYAVTTTSSKEGNTPEEAVANLWLELNK